MKANRLIHSTSPYLLQHAHNPVDWFEWNDEALQRAQRENKPILVSIGYSSCHWCHVMEHQSFENDDIATLMNEYFVCIKVDREERPDIDQVYMEAVQAMGVNGGWPLNVFLTPEQKPFFGGTYFAPQAWAQVLVNINKAWQHNREKVNDTAEELKRILSTNDIERFRQSNQVQSLKQEIAVSYDKLKNNFDRVWGGLEKAPKFIMPSIWQWLLRYHKLTNNEEVLQHVTLTLDRILYGGIYDQLGGGFARYSVDKEWFAPHFEKMLYDNAQLLSLYAEAFSITNNPEYKRAVYETFDWLKREMMHPEGAFYSALDADSEGEEGKFYVWNDSELRSVSGSDYGKAKSLYETTEDGNWEHGNNILKRNPSSGLSEMEINRFRQILLTKRNERIRPGLDDKIIASWNAMTIIGLTDAYRYTADPEFLKAAKNTLHLLEQKLLDGHTIHRSYKNKHSVTEGFLDDYAYLIAAYIQLHQVTLDEMYILKAKLFTESTLKKFYDKKDGFFHYSAAEDLIARKKEIFDNVIPSSNSVMSKNLLLLGSIFEKEEWTSIAVTMIDSLRHVIHAELQYTGNWGMAAMETQHTFYEVVLSGASAEAKHKELLSTFNPFALYMKAESNSTLPLTIGKDKGELIYVCFNKSCKLPVESVPEALAQLT